MRNDSIFLTGMNSGTISKVERNKEKEQLKKEAKLRTKAVITPAVEPVLEEIQKEKDRTTLELFTLVDGEPKADMEAQIMALKMYRASMDTLRSRITNIMRTQKDT